MSPDPPRRPPRRKPPSRPKRLRPGPLSAKRPFAGPGAATSKALGLKAGLSREWMEELQNTSRPHRLDRAAQTIADALEAFVSEDFTRAAEMAERAKDEVPRSGRIRELLGLSYYRMGRWRDALREMLAYRRLTGRVDENHVIADCYRALQRPEKALEAIDEVAPKDVEPEVWAEVAIVAASTLAEFGEIDRALARLARADLNPIQVEPYHLRLWYVRSDLLERAGRNREARAGWERIAAEDPAFFDVEERLSRLHGAE
jgi:tetratricopeptide (TPR) repeat protein